jgi:hypothetical protein
MRTTQTATACSLMQMTRQLIVRAGNDQHLRICRQSGALDDRLALQLASRPPLSDSHFRKSLIA